MSNNKDIEWEAPFHVESSSDISITFHADVEFGNPWCKCKNFGICRINPVSRISSKDNNVPKSDSQALQVRITYLSPNHIRMLFSKHLMNAVCQQIYFSSTYFLIEGDYEAKLFLEQKNTYVKLHIPRGKYLIEASKQFYSIDFYS